MVRLEVEMAVIGTVNELLTKEENVGEVEETGSKYLSMDEKIVFEYSRMIEARSGYAVINGFSSSSLNRFFANCNRLFQYDPYESVQRDKESYRLRIEELLPPQEIPNGGLRRLKKSQVGTLIGRMMDILDPSVNYPVDFLEDMKLLHVLEDNRENAYELAAE